MVPTACAGGVRERKEEAGWPWEGGGGRRRKKHGKEDKVDGWGGMRSEVRGGGDRASLGKPEVALTDTTLLPLPSLVRAVLLPVLPPSPPPHPLVLYVSFFPQFHIVPVFLRPFPHLFIEPTRGVPTV